MLFRKFVTILGLATCGVLGSPAIFAGQDSTPPAGAATPEKANQDETPKPAAEADPAAAQDENKSDADKDLEKAIDLKSKAKTTRDLDEVVSLCESAIAKGLDDASKTLAEAMIKSTLFEHAKQLGERIFNGPRDSRWRFLRREALSRLEKVLKIDPKMVEAHLMTARLEILPGGDLTEARTALNRAIELATNQSALLSEALLIRAALAEDEESQLADLNQAIIIDPANVKALLARAQYHSAHEAYDSAVADIRAAQEQGYSEMAGTEMLIQNLIAAKQLDDADMEIEKAMANDPENKAYYRLRAQIRSEQKKPDEALADIERVLEGDEKNVDALLLKTSILYDQKRLDEALATVEKVLESQPGLVRGILMRGAIYGGQEKYDQAIEDIKQLVEFAPGEDRFQLQLAMYYNAAKKSAEAIKIYDSILEDSPESDDAIRGRGDARLSLGEHEKAIADYERAIEIQKDKNAPDAGTINNLAWVLATSPKAELRDGKRSIELGQRACELTEYKESYAVSTLAAGYAEIGDFDKAREWGAKAVELGEKEKSDSLDNLRRELEGYQRNKPWRELLSEDLAGPEGEETRKSDLAKEKESAEANQSSGDKAEGEKKVESSQDKTEVDPEKKSGESVPKQIDESKDG